MNPLQSLKEQRLHAAKASGGASSSVIANRILEIVEDFDLRGRLLDYGAGIGKLTRQLWALGRFDQITGADLLPRPDGLSNTIDWQCLDLNQSEGLSEASFDTVVAAEVIEHLENPRAVAREWYRTLKTGGTLIVSTPNNESFRSVVALLIRGHYVEFGDNSYPAHITALLRKDLLRILGEAGFSGVQFHFTNAGGIPKLPVITWQQLSFGMLKGCRFSDNIIVTARK